MKTTLSEIANNKGIAIGIVVCLSLMAGAVSVQRISYTNDSLKYMAVAEQIVLGRGIRSPIFGLMDRPDEHGTVLLTDSPPLYPLLLASLLEIDFQKTTAAQIINIFACLLSALSCYVILMRLSTYGFASIACIAMVIVTLLDVTRYVWTESIFIAIFLCTIAILQTSRYRGRFRFLWIIGASLTAAACILIRYAGVVLVVVLAYESIVELRKSKLQHALCVACCATLLPLSTFIALLIRNFWVTGHIFGTSLPRHDLGRPIFAALKGTIMSTLSLIGFHNTVIYWVLFTLIALGVISTIVHPKSRAGIRQVAPLGLDLVIFAFFSYLVFITYSMAHWLWHYESRFFVPLAVLAIIAIIGFFHAKLRFVSGGMDILHTTLVIIAMFSLFTVCILQIPRKHWESRLPSPPNNETFKWLIKNCPRNKAIATNIAMTTAYFGFPSLYLPHRSWDPNAQLPTDLNRLLPERMALMGVKYLILFSGPEGLKSENWGEFIAALSRRESSSELFMKRFSCKSGVVYELVQ